VSPADRDKGGENVGDAERPLTPYERFVAATKRVLSVSKEELEKREAAWRKKRVAKRRRD
jgi:hypothetical protein